MSGAWQGEGWYTFNLWDTERNDWVSPERPEAVWVENEDDFKQFSMVDVEWHKCVSEYLGSDDLPDDKGVLIAERFFWSLSPSARKEYEKRFD